MIYSYLWICYDSWWHHRTRESCIAATLFYFYNMYSAAKRSAGKHPGPYRRTYDSFPQAVPGLPLRFPEKIRREDRNRIK